jgi:hypothetical protein
MRVLGQVAGTVLGLFVVSGCSSADGGGLGAGGTGTAGETGAAGSGAESGASSSGSGGRGGSNPGSGGRGGNGPDSSGALAGSSTGGANTAGGGAGNGGLSGSGGGASSHHFSIKFDYRFDTLAFFTAERRAALEAAGALWANLIHDDFPTLPKGTGIRLKNPENRDEDVWVNSIEEDVDDLIVFVGTSEAISGLGRGGPSGTTQTDDPVLAAALATRRDGSNFEPWAGSISFKASSNFFFDQTPATADDIPDQASDFITTAAHELGHVLGFSSGCAALLALTSGSTFIGPTAQAVYGSPVPLVTDLGHFQEGLKSDGTETLMDPGMAAGTRIAPTRLDRAVFIDIGYDIAK